MSLGRRTAPTLVNQQFNSPIKLYSPESVQDALSKHTQALSNGAIGIDFHQLAAPNLANSAVLKMLEEEERQRGGKEDISGTETGRNDPFKWPPKDLGHRIHGISDDSKYRHCSFSAFYFSTLPGLKRVAWPPLPENSVSTLTQQDVYTKVSESQQGQQNTWENSFDQLPASPPQKRPEQNNQFYPPPQQQLYQTQHEPPPATVVLRPAAPVSQEPPPVFTSQPAATKAVGGKMRMRGDEKWPPTAYKQQAAAENEARIALAKGPAFRPKKVHKDYTAFFAQNALSPNYPAYKAPPGTQHYIEEGTSTF